MREIVAGVAACFLYFQTRQIRNDKNRSLPEVATVFTVPHAGAGFKPNQASPFIIYFQAEKRYATVLPM